MRGVLESRPVRHPPIRADPLNTRDQHSQFGNTPTYPENPPPPGETRSTFSKGRKLPLERDATRPAGPQPRGPVGLRCSASVGAVLRSFETIPGKLAGERSATRHRCRLDTRQRACGDRSADVRQSRADLLQIRDRRCDVVGVVRGVGAGSQEQTAVDDGLRDRQHLGKHRRANQAQHIIAAASERVEVSVVRVRSKSRPPMLPEGIREW